MVAISLGTVFIHAGEEFYRTKNGIENSYKSEDFINRYDYARKDQFKQDIAGLRDLLAIRKQYKEFRMHNPHEIEQKMIFMEEFSNLHTVCYYLEGAEYRLVVVVKNTRDSYSLLLNHATMIYGNHHALNLQQENYLLEDIGVYIFKEVR